MAGSFWGCDIGGSSNTFLARIDPNRATFSAGKFPGSTTDIAQHIWRESTGDVAPMVLTIDAVLSHDIDSDKGWRPADRYLRSLLDHHLATSPGASVVVSPSAFMGHRHIELGAVYGAYALVAETHPTACLAFMGAKIDDLKRYKKEPAALERLAAWLFASWFPSAPRRALQDGEVDAVVCAMVAAAIGGHRFGTLELFTPVLESDAPGRIDLPRSSLAGVAPFYLLRDQAAFQFFLDNRRPT